MPVSQPDDLTVEEVGLDVAGVATQRLPGGVARRGLPSRYRTYGRSVDACFRGDLERDEFDSRVPQHVFTFTAHRGHHRADVGRLGGQGAGSVAQVAQ